MNNLIERRGGGLMRDDWVEAFFDEVLEIISGKNQKQVVDEDGKYPIYGSGGVMGRANDYLCEKGTTIIGRKGTINSPIFVNEKFWNVDTAFGLAAYPALRKKYLHFFAVLFNFKKLDKSTTIPSLAKRDLLKIVIPLAPLPEQRAIVAKIEGLFSDLDQGIADLKTAQSQLKIYRQAVLKKAFEGRWKTVMVEDVAEVKTGATPKRGNASYWENGNVPWVTSGAVNSVFISESNEFITEVALKETNCKVIEAGSLLIAMYGEGKTRGKCSELRINAAMNQALAALTIKPEHLNSKNFIKWFFVKNYEDIRLLSSGGVQPNLNLTIIKNTVLPFPPLAEQHQIVREIETRLSVCDEVEMTILQSLSTAEALRQSILKKAFSGELLTAAEWSACRAAPDWEPAAALLARIQAKEVGVTRGSPKKGFKL